MPDPLQKGDTIYIIAPSGRVDPDLFEQGLTLLKDEGFKPVVDPKIFTQDRYLAGPDLLRHQLLWDALHSPHVRAIWAARGGYGAARLLPYLDLELLRQSAVNTWLIGFSDISALHSAWARAGFCSMHGPHITTLPTWRPCARQELWSGLMAPSVQTFQGMTVRGTKPRQGPLLGGNLTVLTSLVGTGFLPSWKGAVVFLEDIGEPPYRLDRSVTQLRQAGALDGVAGIAIGQLTYGTPEKIASYPQEATDAILSALEGLDIPVVAQIPVGHEPTSRPLLLGAKSILDARCGTLTTYV